jgi:hypothetical protein
MRHKITAADRWAARTLFSVTLARNMYNQRLEREANKRTGTYVR